MLTTDFPAQAGDSDQIVVQARQGTLRSPAAETAVTSMLARVARLPHVRSVTSPYGPGGQISKDGTIGLATVNLDAQATTSRTRPSRRWYPPPSPPTARC